MLTVLHIWLAYQLNPLNTHSTTKINFSHTKAAVYINVTYLCWKCLQMMLLIELNGEVCQRKTAALGGRNGALHHSPVQLVSNTSAVWSERLLLSSHAYVVVLLFLFSWSLLSDPVLNAPKQQQVPLQTCMASTKGCAFVYSILFTGCRLLRSRDTFRDHVKILFCTCNHGAWISVRHLQRQNTFTFVLSYFVYSLFCYFPIF